MAEDWADVKARKIAKYIPISNMSVNWLPAVVRIATAAASVVRDPDLREIARQRVYLHVLESLDPPVG